MADHLKVSPPDSEDEILAAEIIYDAKEIGFTIKEIERLSARRLTFEPFLIALADFLDVELPSRSGKHSLVIKKS
jgi:hypothetical protein